MLAEKIQLEADEHILIHVRKHWFVLLLQMLGVVGVGIAPFLCYFVFSMTPIFSQLPAPVLEKIFGNGALIVAVYTIWIIPCWMTLFNIWTNYYLDVWTITNKRLISVDQKMLFNRTTGSFRLERLQDLNVAITGIIPTLLNFGNLEAQTASGDREFNAINIPNPQELKALILSAADAITYNKNPLPEQDAGL